MKKLVLILFLALWTFSSYAQIQTDTICQGDSVLFHGKYYSTSGLHMYSVKVIDHIDTIFIGGSPVLDTVYRDSVLATLVLYVEPVKIHNRQVNRCNGDTFYHNGIAYTKSALVYDTFYSRAGCDSIVRLSINFHPYYYLVTSDAICQGDYYQFGRRRLTQPGVYIDTLQSQYGCDSIIQLSLAVNDTFHEEIFDTICSGMVYQWYGRLLSVAGTYQIIDVSSFGCDSIHTLHLFVRANILRPTKDTICQGDSCLFRGSYYKTTGTYDDTVYVPGSCDTVFRLSLQVNQHVRINRNVTICGNDSFPWAGKIYKVSGVYYDTLPGRKGECDTFTVINLTVLPAPVTTLTKGICKETSFYYRGRIINKPGIYYDTLIAVNGCDSIIRLVVNEHPSYITKDSAFICEGDSNIFFDMVLYNEGVYTKYLSSKDSCDSIFIRTLIVHKNDTVNFNIHRCDHRPYVFFGLPITQPGSYQHILTNRFGCDSIINLEFDTTPYFYEEYAHICEGETYQFHGYTFSTEGVHYASFRGIYDCDSTYKLYLTVGRRKEFVTDTAICRGQPFFWRGKQYVKSGTYMDSFASSLGCDSVFVLNLTINEPKHFTVINNFCQGDSLIFNDRVIKHSINIDDTLRAFSGCDSIVHYRFNMQPTFHHSDTVDLCIGSAYRWHGQTINQSGVYWDSLKTISGCDSVFELTVRAVHSQTTPLAATICNGEYYDFNGKRLYSSGTYYDTIYNSQGCADVFILELTVNPTYLVTENITLCSGQSFWYKGIYISKPGVYYDSLTTSVGCDSVCKIIVNRASSYFYSDTARIYQGATYNFHGRHLRIAGTYYDSLKTVSGCDSIYQLVLFVTPEFHQIEYATICDNEYYNFRGRKLNIPGVYWDSLKTYNNFDSVYELRLAVNPTYIFTTEHTECYGRSFNYRGRRITKPGVYYDSLYTINGCDSVYNLIFNWSDTYMFEDTAVICRGSVYNFRGRDITNAGSYYDSLKTQQGCDSIYLLYLIVKDHFYDEMTDTICEGDVYDFHGRLLTEPGVYYDSVKTSYGCDSVYKLTLSKFPKYEFTTVVEQCYGVKWTYRGMLIDKPGVYYDSLVSSKGCDSVYKLVYTWLADYHFYDTATICAGDYYNFRGRDIHLAGTYYDSMQTSRGCDSIFELYLNVVKTFHNVQTVNICSNEYYNFRGRYLNQSGIYFDSIKNPYGCDSVYELRLTILPEYLIPEYVEFCQGSSYQYKGRTITKPGIYYDSLKTKAGCDSVIQLTVNFTPLYLYSDTTTICAGSSYTWRGRDLTRAGVYYDSLTTIRGCDSIYQLVLSVVQPFYDVQYVEICSNEYYDFHGRHLTESGIYFDSLKNIQGCDSVYELHLSIRPHYLFDNFIEVCYGNSISYRGRTISVPGIYYDSLLTHDGCDSVYRLVFSWKSRYLFTDTAIICAGGSYTWRGRDLTRAGVYYDSLTTLSGCDSIYQIVLSVAPSFYDIQYVDICSNEYYDFHGRHLTESGVYYDSLKDLQGCDSVYELRLTIKPHYLFDSFIEVCYGNSISYRGRTISVPGIYYDSLLTHDGCDSVYRLVFSWKSRYLFTDTAIICAGGSYIWRGRDLTRAGVYYDSLTTLSGCDSIYQIVLSVAPSFYDIQYVDICSNEYYDFHGRHLTESGVYYDSLKDLQGCDSVYELRLTIKPHYVFDNFIEVCYGNSITYRGRTISVPGIYYDSLLTHDGCDSVYRLVFSWKSRYLFTDTARICAGGSYTWRGRDLTRAGVYYDSLLTYDGCDSVYQLVLHVNHSYQNNVDTTICDYEFFAIRGKRITQSGTYYDTLTTSSGCDSITIYNLTVNPSYLFETRTTLCHGSDIFFRGKHLTQPGIYYDSMKTVAGCDSVFKMVLNWSPVYLIVDTAVLCNGSSYNFRGRTITGAGVYFDSLLTVAGCDSVYKLVVHTGDGHYREENINLCTNQSYYLHGKLVTQSGIYWDSLHTVTGCDSVIKYIISIDSAKFTTIHADICSNEIYYRSDGSTVNKTGIYYDSLFTTTGCDSIVKVVLNVHAYRLYSDTAEICKGNTFNWRGRTLRASGVYWDSLVSTHGCDSIFKLLLINHSYYTEIDTTICDNTVFRFNNKVYTSSGIYYDTLLTVLGCDSVFKIDLTINPTYNIVRHITMCDTDFPIPFAGGFVNQTGVYHDTTTTLLGCDSINTLYLTVVPTYILTEDTICEDEIYTWRGKQYTMPGLYTDTVLDQTEAHCDIIFALRLHTVQKTNLYSIDIAPYICADDLEYSIVPRYTGAKPDAYTVRYTSVEISKQSEIVNADFTTSPIIIPLPLSVDGDSLRPDTYSGFIEVYNRVCDANPLSIDFTLNIRYPSYIVEQHWNDVVAILNSNYNGGYTFSKYEWYVNDILIQSITGSNMFLPNLRTGDKVEVALTREGENYSVLTCPIWMQDLSYLEVTDYPIAVDRTILRSNAQTRIIASAAGSYALYTASGVMICSGSFPADSETTVTLPAVSGIYFLNVISANESKTFKLLVQ